MVSENYNKLIKKKWKYHGEEKPDEEVSGHTRYLFNNGKSDDVCFLSFYYSNNYIVDQIELQFVNTEKFEKYKKQIKTLGFKKINSINEHNQLVDIFKKNKIIVKLITANEIKESKPEYFYVINILDYEDYLNEK